jgi:hypothetical protein
LVEANETLIQAAQAHDANPTEASMIALQAAQTEVNDIRLSYQGMGDSPYHLNLSPHLWSLLDNDEAESLANTILQAKPDEVIGKWQEIMLRYPDEDHQWIVFEDVAAQGLKFEHIMSFFVRDEHFAHTFISAQRLTDSERSILSDDKRSNFIAQAQENPQFVAWAQSARDSGARDEYIAGAASALVNYAMKINAQGQADMNDAVELAAKNVFGWMQSVDTGDGVVAIDVRRHTPEDVEVLNDFLPDAIGFLDLKDINPRHFATVTAGFNQKDREQFISDVVIDRANVWLAADRDGLSVILMGREGPGGDQFVVTDRDEVPYRIHIEDLPKRNLRLLPEDANADRARWLAPLGGPKFSTRSNWPFKGTHGNRDSDLIYQIDF